VLLIMKKGADEAGFVEQRKSTSRSRLSRKRRRSRPFPCHIETHRSGLRSGSHMHCSEYLHAVYSRCLTLDLSSVISSYLLRMPPRSSTSLRGVSHLRTLKLCSGTDTSTTQLPRPDPLQRAQIGPSTGKPDDSDPSLCPNLPWSTRWTTFAVPKACPSLLRRLFRARVSRASRLTGSSRSSAAAVSRRKRRLRKGFERRSTMNHSVTPLKRTSMRRSLDEQPLARRQVRPCALYFLGVALIFVDA
jgi:hypothetical protein